MTKIKHFVFNAFQVNAFVIYDDTKKAVIIDGAANSERELNELLGFIKNNELEPEYIISTHGHLDHICGNFDLKSEFNIPVLMNNCDDLWVERAMDQAALYSFDMKKPPMADKNIEDGEIIKFGNSELIALHIPGHSPGSIAFYDKEGGYIIAGDTLFQHSIGRTDFPMGNHEDLINSIKNKLFILPDDTLILPGHGPDTTIREEKKCNPFF
ncbi:MAG: MBL fold metallo-hydrolase [Bacteroidales bacterium]|jgi:glyoxylase-like metal-dependent hydrolase (beta-lactamase superfamily II)|nr:MBL fold metallo-hydrolase [Bacteroidales bacterium]